MLALLMMIYIACALENPPSPLFKGEQDFACHFYAAIEHKL
jgi:hypothetical protein